MSRISLRLVDGEENASYLEEGGQLRLQRCPGAGLGRCSKQLSCPVSQQGHTSFFHQLFQPLPLAGAFSAGRAEVYVEEEQQFEPLERQGACLHMRRTLGSSTAAYSSVGGRHLASNRVQQPQGNLAKKHVYFSEHCAML